MDLQKSLLFNVFSNSYFNMIPMPQLSEKSIGKETVKYKVISFLSFPSFQTGKPAPQVRMTVDFCASS